jgi:hypothetical protein
MKSTFTVRLGSLAGAALAIGVVASMPVGAETLVEQVTDTRLVLAFRVDPAELQKVFPGPWDIVGTAAGPAKDLTVPANVAAFINVGSMLRCHGPRSIRTALQPE